MIMKPKVQLHTEISTYFPMSALQPYLPPGGMVWKAPLEETTAIVQAAVGRMARERDLMFRDTVIFIVHQEDEGSMQLRCLDGKPALNARLTSVVLDGRELDENKCHFEYNAEEGILNILFDEGQAEVTFEYWAHLPEAYRLQITGCDLFDDIDIIRAAVCVKPEED